MPKRTDLKKILIIGSGPIVIGQACEFDYSGTQACKALREEGYQVVLVNSNPATIMTDPEMADRTYIEPITWEYVAKIIEVERPDALLPTLGGQTGLNTAMDLVRAKVLERFGVELIGANAAAIEKAEDRELFKKAMIKIGIDVPQSFLVHSLEEAKHVRDRIGLPCVLRPSFTLGGTGGGVAYNRDEYLDLVQRGLELSPVGSVLVEESVLGWKEFELEVMRDVADNVVIVCSIENFDPMGVHTGDSITVAPAQTLSDKEYQRMRDAAIAIIREIGVETGGSNIQFAVNPADGRMIAIEMNPRVSRSSALASKATGFPIAKIAAKLAVGYRLDELQNDITTPRGLTRIAGPAWKSASESTPATSACFEPTIDYVVTKVPRWAFEKFPGADPTLTTQMKSVGETMAIGRTFKESLQKALRGLETGRFGIGCDRNDLWGTSRQPGMVEIQQKLATPNPERIWHLRYALKAGMTLDDVHRRTRIDPWFLQHIVELVELEERLRQVAGPAAVSDDELWEAKQAGFSDHQLATLWGSTETEVRRRREEGGVLPSFKVVDTCAAEFEAYTPYFYSTYERPFAQVTEAGAAVASLREDEIAPQSDKPRIVIIGGGPNRIGQGIEFDYCCCQAAFALRDAGYETVMINSNPETVSTDYDTSDLLFFEPLTVEDVLNVCERVQPAGVIVQFGGQTPLNLAKALAEHGVPIIGTSVDSIDMAEDRERFRLLVETHGLQQPPSGTALDAHQAVEVARAIGYPILVRPSYVLGGRAMQLVFDEEQLVDYVLRAKDVAQDKPLLIDHFLEDAIEVDVDCVSDGSQTLIGGVMQHIEEAGIHSGDSACVIPPYSLSASVIEEIKQQTRLLAQALSVKGLMNVQFAITNTKNHGSTPTVMILEVNPRASRTVPFVSKATGIALARLAALVMVGKTLAELGSPAEVTPAHYSVKESVFPFAKFPGVDTMLGPEMRSTGEVMGIAADFATAFGKSQIASFNPLPETGLVFISVADRDKPDIVPVAQELAELGYRLVASAGTARVLRAVGLEVLEICKIQEGRPNLLDLLKNERVGMVINTPSGQSADEARVRAAANAHNISSVTTVAAAQAAVKACRALRNQRLTVNALQDLLKR